MSNDAFSNAVKVRHPTTQHVHRWRQQPSQPFGLHHDWQREGQAEHTTNWQYLCRRVGDMRGARGTQHDEGAAAPLHSVHASETVIQSSTGNHHTVSLV
jgi:hypothetical protein